MSARWVRFGGLAIGAALALSACGGGDGGDGGITGGTGGADGGAAEVTLRVTGTEFAFEPSSLSAPADTLVAVELTNAGTIEHDLTIDEAPLKVTAPAGGTGTGTFELPAGTYPFYCSIPGHREAGMEGTLAVA